MWQNNGNNGPFQNNFNQDNFPQQPINGSNRPGQQFFQPQPLQPMDFNNGEDYTDGDFRPEVGLFNNGAFLQNQSQHARSQAHFSPPPPYNLPQATTPVHSRPAEISARAAELKARLLKGKEDRASSATPPVGLPGITSSQVDTIEGSSSLRGSPGISWPAPNREHANQVDELISEFSSTTRPPKDSGIRQDRSVSALRNTAATPATGYEPAASVSEPAAKSQTGSLGSPTKMAKLASNGKLLGNGGSAKSLGSRHPSNGSLSETSEGEIIEDPTPKKPVPPVEPKEKQSVKPIQSDEQIPRRAREEQAPRPSFGRSQRDESPQTRPPLVNPKSHASRVRDDRREEDGGSRRLDHTDRDLYSAPDRHNHEARDSSETRRKEAKNEQLKREENGRTGRLPKPPTLAEILPHDENLREWLEITGYHNEPYRDKILNRRRAIAALDAQRNKLLKEMEAEERGGLQSADGPTVVMPPPPIPTKAVARADTKSNAETAVPDSQRDRVVSNKRPYSDIHDERDEEGFGKFKRTADRGQRIKEEEGDDIRHHRLNGYESSRHVSGDRREERERFYHDEGRGRGRGIGRERDVSPGVRAYDSRPPARSRGYDSGEDLSDDWQDRREPRPFEIRGGYRGRAYDPNYRGRGRGGRGRGDYQGHQEPRPESGSGLFGSRIANGKPYKDPKGFDRGGKGDTRYFIVKSFNEDNVLKCVQDSVWTTQAQNGPIFAQAFENCKNVILVFSINKSRAFQGYARMESLPGSVEVPAWQKAINWESAGAFKVRWLVICSTRFHRIGHLKNAYNENQAVLIGKDGQEIEENCGAGLIELIDEEVHEALSAWGRSTDRPAWEE